MCTGVIEDLGDSGSYMYPLTKVLGELMILNSYELREYILPHHKGIFDTCRRTHEFSGDPMNIMDCVTDV